jgi:rare lipoprotein A
MAHDKSDKTRQDGRPRQWTALVIAKVVQILCCGCALVAAAPAEAACASQAGMASAYSTAHIGRPTASGERLQAGAMTAAHRRLPFGTMVRVTHSRNGRSVSVRINDRGPFLRGRIIDLSPTAARALGFSGLAQVTLECTG